MSNLNKIKKLTRRLYPTGKAFNYPVNGNIDKLHSGLGVSENSAINDALSILDSILPDNSNFTEDNAKRWEERLGLIDGTENNLEDRKSAIIRKMNHPGNIEARQSRDYLEEQLQLAGFSVYVRENIPAIGVSGNAIRLNQFQLGNYQLRSHIYPNIVANYIDESKDAGFVAGSLKNIFFIEGDADYTSADVPLNRKDEFRQLILKLKPLHSIAYLRINYI